MEPSAQELMEYMGEISKQAYRTAWIEHLEYALWYAVVNGPMTYGRYEIGSEDIKHLRGLSYSCGGWIVFKEDIEQTWVPLAEWQDIFTRNIEFLRLD